MGTIIFDHLVLFRHSGPKKGELPYSSLIFQILCSQGLKPAGLYLTNAPKTFSIHHFIFTPTIVKDLPYQGPDPAPAAPSFNTDEDELVTVPRSFLLQMLRFVGQCKESSTFMIPKIQSLLSNQKWGDKAPSNPASAQAPSISQAQGGTEVIGDTEAAKDDSKAVGTTTSGNDASASF